MIERHFDMFEELTASIGHFDPGMIPIEQVDAENVLELPHALADAGLANAKRLRGAAETAMLRDLQGLNTEVSSIFGFIKIPLKCWGAGAPREPWWLRIEKANLSK